MVLETLKGPEAVREIEDEAIKAEKAIKATQKTVVTASKKEKQADVHSDGLLESGYKDNLTGEHVLPKMIYPVGSV